MILFLEKQFLAGKIDEFPPDEFSIWVDLSGARSKNKILEIILISLGLPPYDRSEALPGGAEEHFVELLTDWMLDHWAIPPKVSMYGVSFINKDDPHLKFWMHSILSYTLLRAITIRLDQNPEDASDFIFFNFQYFY